MKKILVPIIALLVFTAYFVLMNGEGERANTSFSLENDPGNKGIAVLELFTSQGCSSCPAADRLLDRVKSEFPESVVALSYHVDYWNYIGWEDPFSHPDFAKKQSAYNIKFHNSGNYTPEIVINGSEHFVGSDANKMYGAIKIYTGRSSANSVELSDMRSDSKGIHFDYKIKGDLHHKKLRTLLAIDERTTEVKRGENKNRVLKNSNIVVAENETPISDSKGAQSISFPKIVSPDDNLYLVLLVVNKDQDITGATKMLVKK